MRTICKRAPPAELTTWRAPRLAADRGPGMECTYDGLRADKAVVEAVEDGLLREQGGLCAYTGRRISLSNKQAARSPTFHLEHLKAQEHCGYGEDAAYDNLVGCWPGPNQSAEPAYGARRKGSWPQPAQEPLFVSPLRADCTKRFAFSRRGEIRAAIDGDAAARETIARLGLDNDELSELRRQAIRGALSPGDRSLSPQEARQLQKKMVADERAVDSGGSATLMPFCFAIAPALERQIETLEAIARGRAKRE